MHARFRTAAAELVAEDCTRLSFRKPRRGWPESIILAVRYDMQRDGFRAPANPGRPLPIPGEPEIGGRPRMRRGRFSASAKFGPSVQRDGTKNRKGRLFLRCGTDGDR